MDIESKLADLKAMHNLEEPKRSGMDDADIKWRYVKPNYIKANYEFLRGKSQNHLSGSLEQVVENLVKTWEMEASHKADLKQWTTVDYKNYQVSCNGSEPVGGEVAKEVGNYNALLQGCPSYEKFGPLSFEASHNLFRDSFTEGFPWEVLKVLCGPPNLIFTWRHWGTFSGSFRGNQGHGKLVEMFGLCRVTVTEDLKIQLLEVFLDGESFVEDMEGRCPFPKKNWPTLLLGEPVTQTG
ncbi:uncharacterized protein LOC131879427 [Tigriopus californicus]|uniref:uncharacterized protein LOC131879427 n=1 Tax=Tigriopus californicus TaxID=6832 RepID=UPI0027DA7ACD|nr:uncharacterized protein LOC131879427 [Tigriopus californicus]